MKIIYRMFLAANSIIMFFAVYLIKEHITIFSGNEWLSYILYLIMILLLTLLCLFISRFLPNEMIEGGISEIELVDGTYFPSYLGYIVIALSVNDCTILVVIGLIIYIFTYCSQTLYFNPLFAIFGYRFYYLTMKNGMKLFVITRKPIRKIDGISFYNLKRINDYTFIDRGKDK